MPTFLCHGFRWDRYGIRAIVIMNDLGGVAPDWITSRRSASLILGQLHLENEFLPAPALPEKHDSASASSSSSSLSSSTSLQSFEFYTVAPESSEVKLLEEYDASDTVVANKSYAYVADYVVDVGICANVTEEMAKYEAASKARGEPWIEKLRDKLAPGVDILWYVVVCADEELVLQDGYSEGDDETNDETRKSSCETTRAEDKSSAQEGKVPNSDRGGDRQPGKAPSQDASKTTEQPALRSKPSVAKNIRWLFRKKND